MAKAKLQSRSPNPMTLPSAPVAPMDVQKILTQGLADHQRGETASARRAYESVLLMQPDNFNALQFLGVLLHQTGDDEAGLARLQRAATLQPKDAVVRNNLGGVLKNMRRFKEAAQEFAEAIRLSPQYIDALSNYGTVLYELKRHAEAEKTLRAALALQPAHPEALRRLGHIALLDERFAEAESLFRRFIAVKPGQAEEISNLGYSIQRQGRLEEAEALFRSALDMEKDGNPVLFHNLRTILDLQDKSEQGRAEYREALRRMPKLWSTEVALAHDMFLNGREEAAQNILDDVTEVQGDKAEVWNDIATVYMRIGHFEKAIKSLQRALEIAPDMAAAHANLGNTWLHANRADLAIQSFESALKCEPSNIPARIELTRALRQQGEYDKAHLFARLAMDMPHYSGENVVLLLQLFKGLCDFKSLDEIGDVWDICEKMNIIHLPAIFLDLLVFARNAEETAKFVGLTRKWGASMAAQAKNVPLTAARTPSSDGRLRIGILSSDLRTHAVSRFLRPFMLNHDKTKISLHAYTPHRNSGDALQEMFRKACDKFTFVENMSERQIAEMIRADSIDILIDLNGFTQGTRFGAMAYKPAPVQMSWLGYPFTCGLEAIDYVVMDRFVVPADESTMVEQPLVMPEAWVCFGKFPNVDINPVLPMDRNGYVTFGTLNNPYKYNREVIAAWAAVMNRVPNSRMLFVRPEASSAVLIRNLTEEFAKHGISGDRLYFFNNRNEHRNHLEYYNEIDISLDSFPLTGGTTTCEATWMGVPVVSLVGEAFHQRISYSVLMQCGFEELCTFNTQDFIERAVALVGEHDKLAAWRTDMREILRASPLCDEDRFLHQFQDMLEQVADLHSLR